MSYFHNKEDRNVGTWQNEIVLFVWAAFHFVCVVGFNFYVFVCNAKDLLCEFKHLE